MTYKTYIDESGNTGANLLDKNQEFYTLAAVSVPISKEAHLMEKIRTEFESVREKDEKEIKATNWANSPKKSIVLQRILEELKSARCEFFLVWIEKRYMIASLIVQSFFDREYNDMVDDTWQPLNKKDKKAKQYFYDILDDEDLNVVAPIFNPKSEIDNGKKTLSLKLEDVERALSRIISKTTNRTYLKLLRGCRIQQLFEEDLAVTNNETCNGNKYHSPNYLSFPALGEMVVSFCQRTNSKTDLIFDSNYYDSDYEQIYNCLTKMRELTYAEEQMYGLSWKDRTTNFSAYNSKNSVLLQAADILATSALRTIKKIFNNKELDEYDHYISRLLFGLYQSSGKVFTQIANKWIEDRLFIRLLEVVLGVRK